VSHSVNAPGKLCRATFQKEAELRCTKTDRISTGLHGLGCSCIAFPTSPRTLDAGLTMITQGLAWWYRAYARE
jgi:hypothetical protein